MEGLPWFLGELLWGSLTAARRGSCTFSHQATINHHWSPRHTGAPLSTHLYVCTYVYIYHIDRQICLLEDGRVLKSHYQVLPLLSSVWVFLKGRLFGNEVLKAQQINRSWNASKNTTFFLNRAASYCWDHLLSSWIAFPRLKNNRLKI